MASGGEPALSNVRVYQTERAARIVFHLTQSVPFHWRLTAARRAELVLPAFVDRPGMLSAFESGPLVTLRREPGAQSLVIRFAFEHEVVARAFYLPTPFRIVIDAERVDLVAGRDAGALQKVVRVALDPGHGGTDPGAVGPTGLQEKDVVLDIAHRAAPLLARELNITTLLTRDVDHRVPLEERIARANEFGADLFLSIHCNAHRRPEACGILSFVLAPGTDALANSLATQENEGAPSDGGEFSRQFANSWLTHQSRLMAALLQRSSVVSVKPLAPEVVDGGVRSAGFYVLAGASMPAVLFEASFISNPEEEGLLRSEGYRQRLADGLVNAVRAYQAGYGRGPDNGPPRAG